MRTLCQRRVAQSLAAGFVRLKTRLLPTKCRSTFRRRAPAASALPLVLSRVHWVRPELVAEVKYLAWTDDNLLRQVVYEGLREKAGGRRGSPPVPH
jgi:ATP-dependent DNA ligase